MRRPRLKAPPKRPPQHPHPHARAPRRRGFRISTRAILIATAATMALMLAAAFVPLLIPTSTYRGWVEERLGRHFDARVAIEKFRFQLLPYPGYTMTNFVLASRGTPFAGQPILAAEKVRGSLSFWGLLGGRVVTAVTASNVTFDVRRAEGISNLGQMLGLAAGEPPAPPGLPAVLSAEEAKAGGVPPAGPAAPGPSPFPALKALPAIEAPAEIPAAEEKPAEAAEPAGENKPSGPTTPAPGAPADTLQKTLRALPPAPQKGSPQAELFRRLILGAAWAAEGDEAGPEPAIILTSLAISGGRFQLWEEGAVAVALSDVDFSAADLSFAGGVAADVRMTGKAADGAGVGAAGRIAVDAARRELSSRALKGQVAGAQVVVDFSVNYGADPVSFDVHLATPDLAPRALATMLSLRGMKLPAGLTWQGPVAADASLRGTRDAMEITAQLEAAPARVGFAEHFAKGAGLPFKASLALLVTPPAVTLRQAQATLGQEAVVAKGELVRGEEPRLTLNIGGSNLDGSALKLFFPKLAVLDALEELELSLDVEGVPGGAAPLAMRASFKAKRAAIAGVEVADAEGTLERIVPAAAPAPPLAGVAMPTLKAACAGGTLTGNGQLAAADGGLELVFDGVIADIDAAALPPLAGAIEGTASMVVRLTSRGSDGTALAREAKVSGSLVLPEGAFRELRIGPQLFTDELWKRLEDAAPAKLDAAAEAKLAALAGEVKDLRASFSSAGGKIAVETAVWTQGPVGIAAKGEIDGAAVSGEGEVTLEKGIAAQLVPPAPARKALLAADGTLGVPVTFGGKFPAIAASLDGEKLAAVLKERVAAAAPPPKPPAPPPAAASPAPAAAKKAPAEGTASPAAKAPAKAPAKKPVLTPEKSPKPSAPPTEEQVDDILKVIIGQ